MTPPATPIMANGVESWNHPVMATSVVYMQKEEGRNAERKKNKCKKIVKKESVKEMCPGPQLGKDAPPTCWRAEHSRAQDEECQHQAAHV